jgi:hypothetical protein
MAIKKKASLGVIEFIHPEDDAIDLELCEETGSPKSDIEAYRKDWDFEKNCVLKDGVQPTVFKLNFSLPYKKQIAIKNASIGNVGEGGATFALGSHAAQAVRSILVDIVNPDDMPLNERIVFKKTGDNLVADSTMAELEDLGIVDDIYSFWLANKSNPEHLKKR